MNVLTRLVHTLRLHERVGRFLESLALISIAQFHVGMAFQLRVLVRVGRIDAVLWYRV